MRAAGRDSTIDAQNTSERKKFRYSKLCGCLITTGRLHNSIVIILSSKKISRTCAFFPLRSLTIQTFFFAFALPSRYLCTYVRALIEFTVEYGQFFLHCRGAIYGLFILRYINRKEKKKTRSFFNVLTRSLVRGRDFSAILTEANKTCEAKTGREGGGSGQKPETRCRSHSRRRENPRVKFVSPYRTHKSQFGIWFYWFSVPPSLDFHKFAENFILFDDRIESTFQNSPQSGFTSSRFEFGRSNERAAIQIWWQNERQD